MLVSEAQILKLCLYLVQTKTVGQRSVYVQRLSCNLVLLVWSLRLQGTHVVQAVADFYQDDPYIVAHGEQQFLEILCLS